MTKNELIEKLCQALIAARDELIVSGNWQAHARQMINEALFAARQARLEEQSPFPDIAAEPK